MFTAVNKWPLFDQINRPRIGSFMEEIDEILSGPRYDTRNEPNMEPVLIPRTNLMACSSATHRPEQPVTIKELLRTGSSIHERDVNGDTCLHAIISMAHPAQPWVVQSLSTLIKAGVDSRKRNHTGLTAHDIACDTAPEFGSFRKDVLLQALLESGVHVNDDRLLAPRSLTQFYTAMHHERVCGGYAGQEATFYRKALCSRLKNYVDYHHLNVWTSIQEAAIDRILSTDTSKWTTNPDLTFREILDYLQPIVHCKSRVMNMRRERLPSQVWQGLPANLDWPQMVETALTAAVLEFDWFRPVDPEDVFLSQIDNLIEQLEDLDIGDQSRENIDRLIEVLQNSIPSYRAVSITKIDSDVSNTSSRSIGSDGASSSTTPQTERSSTLSLETDLQPAGHLRESDIGRKESIAKTPAEYYPPELKARRVKVLVDPVAMDDVKILGELGAEGSRRQKWRFTTRRKKT